ncbi:MAG TPA: MbnP family protein [Polyangia bacterium]|nr:MbnP family protein [Polyangia bacterium]
MYLATLLVACSSDPPFSGNDGGGAWTGKPLSACDESPKAQPGARTIVTVVVDPTYAGKPVVFGELFALPNGGTLTVSNFRFFASDLQVVIAGGQLVAVDIVAPDGKPVPYNVHLVNAASASEMTFQLAVPAGDYTGMSLIFGLNDACIRRDPSVSKPPLTYQSQMTWPPPFGFLFLRYESKVTGATGPDAPLAAVAVGGFPGYVFAPRIQAPGAFQVAGTSGITVHLRVALDEMFKAALLPFDPITAAPPIPGPPGTEIEVGDHLLKNADKVSIFSLTAGL